MSATEPLCFLLGVNPAFLSKEENYLLEAELFARLCHELNAWYECEYKVSANLFKSNLMEECVNEDKFVGRIVSDILRTNEYTLEGIARYTGIHEDVVLDVIDGLNQRPSALFCRRIIELHRSVRKELYESIFEKIKLHYFSDNTNAAVLQ